MYRTTITRATRSLAVPSRSLHSTPAAYKTVTEKAKEMADTVRRFALNDGISLLTWTSNEQVNKKVGQGLASAIDSSESVAQATKETVGSASQATKEKTQEGASMAKEKTEEVSSMAKQKGNQVSYWRRREYKECLLTIFHIGSCRCNSGKGRLQEGSQEVIRHFRHLFTSLHRVMHVFLHWPRH